MTKHQEWTVSEDGRGRYSLELPYVMRDQGLRAADDTVRVVIGDVEDVLRAGGHTELADQAAEMYAEACKLTWDSAGNWTVEPDDSETLRDILQEAEQIEHISVEWCGDAGIVWTTLADEWEWLDDACTGEFDDMGELEHEGDCLAHPNGITQEQRTRIIQLGGDPATFHAQFDLPSGYVAGWANGVYYGIDADGQASS